MLTFIVLGAAGATLAFWYYAAVTGELNLADTALYFIRNIGLVGLLLGGTGLLLVLDAFRRAAVPTAGLLEALERATSGDYGFELQERGPHELRTVARALNRLLDHLRNEQAAQGKMQAAVARALQGTACDDPRHARLIQDWSRLALAENGELLLHPEPVDLGEVTQNTLASLHPEMSARGVAVRATVPAKPLVAELDPVSFGDALGAIILHSLGRTGCGTEMRVDLSESKQPAGVRVQVTDNGRVPAEKEMELLLSEFRADAPVGSGLELPLARTLLEAQGGELSARAEGESGFTVAFFLPFE